MKTYYGFSCASSNLGGRGPGQGRGWTYAASETAAWFHTAEAAERFAQACGWGDAIVETTNDADPDDILDTPEQAWGK